MSLTISSNYAQAVSTEGEPWVQGETRTTALLFTVSSFVSL